MPRRVPADKMRGLVLAGGAKVELEVLMKASWKTALWTLVLLGGLMVAAGCGRTAAGKMEGFVPVKSSVLDSVRYDAATRTLTLAFDSGDVYDYYDVPSEVYEKFMVADSKGAFFHNNIREKYRFHKW